MLTGHATNRRIVRRGWIPDLPDQRDLMFAVHHARAIKAVPNFATSSDLRNSPLMPAVWDQKNQGACVAFATAGAGSFVSAKEYGPAPSIDYEPSCQFIYYCARRIQGTIGFDTGAQLRDGTTVIAQFGIPPNETCPYANDFDPKFAPSDFAFEVARNQEAKQYFRVKQTLDELRASLLAGFPITYGIVLYDSFDTDQTAKDGKIPIPKPGEGVDGGHAMLLCGHDDRAAVFISRNSWGADWGAEGPQGRGYCLIPYEMILNPRLSDDFWTLRLLGGESNAATV